MKTLSYSFTDFDAVKSRFEDKDLKMLAHVCQELTAVVKELQSELRVAQAEIKALKTRTRSF